MQAKISSKAAYWQRLRIVEGTGGLKTLLLLLLCSLCYADKVDDCIRDTREAIHQANSHVPQMQHDTSIGIDLYNDFISKNPDEPRLALIQVYKALCMCHNSFVKGDDGLYLQGMAIFDSVIATSLDDAIVGRALRGKAQWLQQKGDLSAADAQYVAALSKVVNATDAAGIKFQRALIAEKQGDFASAAAICEDIEINNTAYAEANASVARHKLRMQVQDRIKALRTATVTSKEAVTGYIADLKTQFPGQTDAVMLGLLNTVSEGLWRKSRREGDARYALVAKQICEEVLADTDLSKNKLAGDFICTLGDFAYYNGQYETAAQYFASVTADNAAPDMQGKALFRLGEIALDSGDKIAAEQYYSQLINQFPDDRLREVAESRLYNIQTGAFLP